MNQIIHNLGFSLLIIYIITAVLCAESEKRRDLHILGLYPLSGHRWPGGKAVWNGAKLAIRDVNARPDVLPGYRLVLHVKDTAVSIYLFVYEFISCPFIYICVYYFNEFCCVFFEHFNYDISCILYIHDDTKVFAFGHYNGCHFFHT